MRLFVSTFLLLFASPVLAAMSDTEVRQEIIRESLANYPGPCPCPYNTMRNGRRCGKVSAYVRPGGYSPICYESDVTQGMVQLYRRKHGE